MWVITYALLVQLCPFLNDGPCTYSSNWSGYSEFSTPEECEAARYAQGELPSHFTCQERIKYVGPH